MTIETPPVIAIIGHPNAGKSSVVATLAEDDSVPIGEIPGTTRAVHPYRALIDGRTVLTFLDTPGFHNPTLLREWFGKNKQEPNLPAAFIDTHRDDKEFEHECRLLQPLAAGSGVVFVVDGSNDITHHDEAEMELISLTGLPRIAILNNPTRHDDFMASWDRRLRRYFSAVRVFNAHRATFAERIDLLQALATVYTDPKNGLVDAIEAMKRQWDIRMAQSTAVIIKLLREALTLEVELRPVVADAKGEEKREQIHLQLTARLKKELRRLEKQARGEIRVLFRHNEWCPPEDSLSQKDLFSDEVARALGLGLKKAALQGAAAGATAGAGVDLALAQISFGVFMAAGGALGGVGQVIRQVRKKPLEVAKAFQGDKGYSMGPVKNPQFPYVLLDRMILYCVQAMNWSHGRKGADERDPDRAPERPISRKEGYADDLSNTDLKALGRFFTDCRKGKIPSRYEEQANTIISGILTALSKDQAKQLPRMQGSEDDLDSK